MTRRASPHPTELELRILKVLWDREQPLTVRQVRDALAEDGRDLAHTSVITTLRTMIDKGQLEQLDPKRGKAFRFVARLRREDVSHRMLDDLVQRVFDGSPEALMLSLFDASELDVEELRRLRKLLNRKLREQGS